MKKLLEPVIVGRPYRCLYGNYRCFDGERWRDCDRYGNILG